MLADTLQLALWKGETLICRCLLVLAVTNTESPAVDSGGEARRPPPQARLI